jgi:hypothetical protein
LQNNFFTHRNSTLRYCEWELSPCFTRLNEA